MDDWVITSAVAAFAVGAGIGVVYVLKRMLGADDDDKEKTRRR